MVTGRRRARPARSPVSSAARLAAGCPERRAAAVSRPVAVPDGVVPTVTRPPPCRPRRRPRHPGTNRRGPSAPSRADHDRACASVRTATWSTTTRSRAAASPAASHAGRKAGSSAPGAPSAEPPDQVTRAGPAPAAWAARRTGSDITQRTAAALSSVTSARHPGRDDEVVVGTRRVPGHGEGRVDGRGDEASDELAGQVLERDLRGQRPRFAASPGLARPPPPAAGSRRAARPRPAGRRCRPPNASAASTTRPAASGRARWSGSMRPARIASSTSCTEYATSSAQSMVCASRQGTPARAAGRPARTQVNTSTSSA